MRWSSIASVVSVVSALLLAPGCLDRTISSVDPDGERVDSRLFPVTPNRDIDLLFVVDNSISMAGEQASLAANFPVFMDVLEGVIGGLPNVHIGIVSSDVGVAGVPGVSGCSGAGDGGLLQLGAGCGALAGGDRFISDVAGDGGVRLRNYGGGLEAQFACMAKLGTDGCGFEMHLESAHRALQPGHNPGFLRPDALLAVVFIADEDDCSADAPELFGPDSPALGTRDSFRCFRFGVECDEDTATLGAKHGCHAHPDSRYLHELDRYVDHLRGLKAKPADVIVAGIVGVHDEDDVVTVAAGPHLAPSCSIPGDPSEHSGARSAVRLGDFLRSFPHRHSQTSICDADLRDGLRATADAIGVAIKDVCVRRPFADRDPRTACDRATGAGCEYECSVTDVRDPYGARVESLIPSCADNGTSAPCWRLVPDAVECPGAPGNLEIEVFRDGRQPPADTYLQIQCVTE